MDTIQGHHVSTYDVSGVAAPAVPPPSAVRAHVPVPLSVAPATPAPPITPEVSSRLVHDLVALVGWMVLAALWWRVVTVTDLGLLRTLVVVVAGSFVLNALVSMHWVRHNQRIFRRKGARTGAPTATLVYDRDWTGRAVTADWDVVRTASLVVVDVDGEHKRFETSTGTPEGRP